MSDDEDLDEYDQDQDESDEDKDNKEMGEGEEKEGGEELEEMLLPNPLTEEVMKEGLSLLCKIGNGLSHAYVKLEAKEKDLSDISLLSSYIHLRYVDLSDNRLVDLSPLNGLTHLLWLKVDNNRLISARLTELPYLQIASFAYNQITDTEGILHPRLVSLDLKGNNIKKVTGLDPQKLGNLHTLELRGNQLESTQGIELPKLKNLFLAQNQLKQIEGLENLEHLTTLHLRDNQINTLSGFSSEMKSLQYLNLRTQMIMSSEVPSLSSLLWKDHILRPSLEDEEPFIPLPLDPRNWKLLQLKFRERSDRAEKGGKAALEGIPFFFFSQQNWAGEGTVR
ncbi:leucine-rich repeat-containing protein 23 isoform X2 [Monodelphis domestica]|uniref:Leucine-rich repeat-containing protein 23 n=1 Tax=Monodelphis domestica TaxID=13616 RepID=A0A5F8G9L9_MONDO|nr:leucine-rich repeat-containing protein 23 isoform X2 [Monodelphis domestica]